MNPLLIYMTKAAFCIAVFFLVYSLFLSRDTLYGRNRIFILFSLLSALFLPFITIQTSNPLNLPVFGKTLSEVLITGTGTNAGSATTGINPVQVLFIVYLAGLTICAGKLLTDILTIMFIITRKNKNENRIIKFQGLNTAAFSAMGYIFINSGLSEEDSQEIIKHEQNHIDKFHFFDIIFIEIVKTLQWFNPFIYMFNRSLRAVHEFQADEGCLRNGVPVTSYQQLLMNQIFKSRIFSLTNSFSNPTLIKKRMIMMTKERSGMLANLKLLMVLPVIAIVMIAFSSCKEKAKLAGSSTEEIAPPPPPPPVQVATDNKVIKGQPSPSDAMAPPPPPPPPPFDVKNGDTTWVEVDEMPLFPGGNAALLNYIQENVKYPDAAKNKGIKGRVIVRFAIETNGTVDKISILKGVSPDIDAEIVRVVSSLPAFEKPGIKDGRPVPVWYMVPITFNLK